MSSQPNSAVEKYGWIAVPRDVSILLSKSANNGSADPIQVSSITVPSTPLSDAVHQYAQSRLPVETFNHSMRVYYYGVAILSHAFPTWSSPSFLETYYLTCLLHDIGTTDENITTTLLSFEFQGGYLVLDLLKSLAAPVEQAESVAEAVIRHQDLGTTGTLSRVSALIQLATIFDNVGRNPELVARETIEGVVALFPRKHWSGCFAKTIRKELSLKPWAHTSHLGEPGFEERVEGNVLMSEWDALE
ncbi:urea hydro-lyase cyanamide [Bisporella sp. PMI_857]|nr:urea hydro-lyase cyanamide [Bisporella sp. PMI_857]